MGDLLVWGVERSVAELPPDQRGEHSTRLSLSFHFDALLLKTLRHASVAFALG